MFKEKSLLLYKNQPAVVTGIENGKITITLPGKNKNPGEIKHIREKDAFLLSPGPVSSPEEALEEILPAFEVQPEEAETFFSGEEPSFRELSELLWGNLSPSKAWTAWNFLSTSPWFVCSSPEDPIGIRRKEDVERENEKREEKEKKEREREAFFLRLRNTAKGKDGGIKLPEDAVFLQDAEALALGKTDKSTALHGAGLPETAEAAHSILIKSGYWDRKKNPWPSRKDRGFSAVSVPVDTPPEKDDMEREDFTYMDAFAIDNEWSDDPDDAVSFHDGKLWIHVADPAASIQPDTPADKEARARGSTLYIPEGVARMLDGKALDYFALGLSEKSRALSFGITFTDTGAIKEVEIKKTFVSVTRMTYKQADEEKENPKLAPLFTIAERNLRRRTEAGAVSIDLPEVKISVDSEKNIGFFPVARTESSAMVMEMMLLAGEAAARFAFKNSIPFQYISQEEPSLPQKLPEGLAGEYAKRRSMKARKTGTIPADHAGLGLGVYSQVTSPLRRYGDLAAHQQLRRFLSGEKLLSADEMTERIAQGDMAQRMCVQAERSTNMHWTINYLLDNPDWTAEASIVEINGKDCTVIIPELALEALITCPPGAKLNGIIRVKSGGADVVKLNPGIYPV